MLFLLQEVTPEPMLLVQFAYRCSEGGGWHDFFAYQDHLVPWSPAKERAGGEQCIRLNLGKGEWMMCCMSTCMLAGRLTMLLASHRCEMSTCNTLVCLLALQWCALQYVPEVSP